MAIAAKNASVEARAEAVMPASTSSFPSESALPALTTNMAASSLTNGGNSCLDEQIERLKRCEYLREGEVKALCLRAREILVDESNVQRVDAPVTVRAHGRSLARGGSTCDFGGYRSVIVYGIIFVVIYVHFAPGGPQVLPSWSDDEKPCVVVVVSQYKLTHLYPSLTI